MWHKAEWIGHPKRLELTRVGLLVKLANHYTTKVALIVFGLVIYEALCFNVAQGWMCPDCVWYKLYAKFFISIYEFSRQQRAPPVKISQSETRIESI